MHGDRPTSIDSGIYGFIANIYFYEIDTPLKQFVVSHANIVRHCLAIHDMVTYLEATLQQLSMIPDRAQLLDTMQAHSV